MAKYFSLFHVEEEWDFNKKERVKRKKGMRSKGRVQ